LMVRNSSETVRVRYLRNTVVSLLCEA